MAIEIEWLNLLLGSTILLIPLAIINILKIRLNKEFFISFIRMAGQLILVGFYLKYVIEWNNPFINILWLLLIVAAGTFTISGRSDVNKKVVFLPVLMGFLISFSIATLFVGFIFIPGGEYFDARYLLPISGMLIGNSISSSIIGIRSLFKDLENRKEMIYFLETYGVTHQDATTESLRNAVLDSFKPMLANVATIGLIWLPGTMTGQIISGSSPIQAIKYQILIVIGYFACCFIATFIALMISKSRAFDEYGVLQTNLVLTDGKHKSKNKKNRR